MQHRLRHSGGLGERIGIGKSSGGWTPKKIESKVLFWGVVSEITGGHMPNKVTGATDFLTVAGSPATYTCPNTAPYIAADTSDRVWFNTDVLQRDATTSELIGYDFGRTLVKYDDLAPYTIREIIILKAGEVLTTAESNSIRDYMWLSIWWDGTLSLYGHTKGNRGIAKSTWVNYYVTIFDGNSDGWYKPRIAACTLNTAGVERVYWDMLIGSSTLGAEQNSGPTVLYAVYYITATTADFFYAGCQVGDTFVCAISKTCSALRKVRKYTGNHLTQPTDANRPINQVFDGIAHFMRTAEMALTQPTFVYALIKQITWTNTDIIFDGGTSNSSTLKQAGVTPQILANAGTNSSVEGNLALDTWGIVRVLFNGANSKLIVNDNAPVTGDFGASNMGNLSLAARGVPALYSNIQVAEILLRHSTDGESVIYNYLNDVKATL
jgi:hypothetical protein